MLRLRNKECLSILVTEDGTVLIRDETGKTLFKAMQTKVVYVDTPIDCHEIRYGEMSND